MTATTHPQDGWYEIRGIAGTRLGRHANRSTVQAQGLDAAIQKARQTVRFHRQYRRAVRVTVRTTGQEGGKVLAVLHSGGFGRARLCRTDRSKFPRRSCRTRSY